MKLSIVTINYNNAADLDKTIQSVIQQTWKDFEYIVIDGGSSDASVEIIKQNEERIDYWVSEKDNGIYHAMNKGISKSSGDYLLMLNSGDMLAGEEVLEKIFGKDCYNEDLLIGDVYKAYNGKLFDKKCFPDTLTFGFLRRQALSHQGTFIKKKLHYIVGFYDESLKYSSDWKFFILAICKYNVSYKHIPSFVTVCDCGGLTYNPANFAEIRSETGLILAQNFPTFISDYAEFDKIKSKEFKNRFMALGGNIKSFIKTTAAKVGLMKKK
jgi:glycosyltransferase involved in cell wall biosynthesis